MASKLIDKYRNRNNLSPSACEDSFFKRFSSVPNQNIELGSPSTAKDFFFTARPKYNPMKRLSTLVKLIEEDKSKKRETRNISNNASSRQFKQEKIEEKRNEVTPIFHIPNTKIDNYGQVTNEYKLSSFLIFTSNQRKNAEYQTTANANGSKRKQKNNKFKSTNHNVIRISEFRNRKNEAREGNHLEEKESSFVYNKLAGKGVCAVKHIDLKRVQTDHRVQEKLIQLERQQSHQHLFNLSLSSIHSGLVSDNQETPDNKSLLEQELAHIRKEIDNLRHTNKDVSTQLLRLVNRRNKLKKILGNRYLLSKYQNNKTGVHA